MRQALTTKVHKTVILSLLAGSGVAFAQTAAPAAPAEPESTLGFNVGAVTEYRYRGISQSRLQPALQGGVDYAHKSGFYVGAWASTIKWIKDAGGDGPVELDLYGGYKGSIADGLGYDVGLLRYQYFNHKLVVSPNTTEIYGALTYGVFTAKYSHSLTNLFGFADSKNSGYLDLSATFDLGNGWSLAPHLGHQVVKRTSAASYTDFSLALGKDLGNGLTASATLYSTDANRGVYFTPAGKFTGRTGLVLGIKYSF